MNPIANCIILPLRLDSSINKNLNGRLHELKVHAQKGKIYLPTNWSSRFYGEALSWFTLD